MSTSAERYSERFERYAARHPRVVDGLLVLALFACAIIGSAFTRPGTDPPFQRTTAIVPLGVACLALLKHRTHPRAVTLVAVACTVIVTALGYEITPLLLAPVLAALYWLTTLAGSRTARPYVVLTLAALTVTSALFDPSDALALVLRVIGFCFWLLLAFAFGSMTLLRRAYLSSVQARAEYAERTREEEARVRVAEERMRIARELHDVVAHHLALANAQAGTAAHLVLTHPQQTKKILTDLTGTTSSALRDLKATLGLLRQDDDPASSTLEPAPGLSRLPELITSYAAAGLRVTLTTTGEPRPLSSGVDLTAYRIVQEALTNVTKHAAAPTARVRLAYLGSRVVITISNDGPGTGPADATAPEPGRGFGIIGMRERAHTMGGELRAAPRPDGGFEVTTTLPLQPPGTPPADDTGPTGRGQE
ncbi:sensor histidine kinase [Streptomyces sp. GZWMJZ-114]|uniref:sensor histidine kinase n=1 Tax=Streptomyces sp. GZWMJZ-114 TaxID=2494734 RepID=UPI001012A738|nr:sensor histidine kinase [Streptomyces sp. GZWMJZ-114]